MKRVLVAVAVLLALVAGSLWNTRHLDALTGEMTALIELSRRESRAGNGDAAAEGLRQAVRVWTEADGYTHVFIRHAEIDSTADAFYELLSLLEGGESEAAEAAYDKLLYHLDSVDSIEHVSVKSVF